MTRIRIFVAAACIAGGLALLWRRPSSDPAKTPPVTPPPRAVAAQAAAPGRDGGAGEALERLAYAQGWAGDLPAPLGAFRAWTERYRAAPPSARAALEAEGVALARERRGAMRDLIVRDPARALAVTVPAVVRQGLPASVLAELEQRLAGTGEFLQQAMTYEGTPPPGAPTRRRVVALGGETYTAHAYGRRAGQPSKEGASLHGIALDREFALHESPLRVLEPGEAFAQKPGEHCPVSQQAVPEIVRLADANRDSINLVEAHGRIWEFCTGESMLELFEQRLIAAEEQSGPRVPPLTSTSGTGGGTTPPTAADPATAWTLGTKKVLVIRADFSDFPGEPVTVASLDATMNSSIRTYYEEASYGQCSIDATITSNVYRLPRTAATYALADNNTGLHTDARTLAAVDYRLTDYDRIVVVFANIGPARLPGSLFAWGGIATVNGSTASINGAFTMRTIAHELGHNHGLKHSSLWTVTDGDPVSANGVSREYGDPFDVMGDASDVDRRHHFNQWCKNLLGWLPDRAVTTVTTSGTYRIFRYDSKDAVLTQPLALRIFRDGVRWYWVGYRQNFPTNGTLTNGANVLWGFNALQESQLLDCTTPGTSALDSALAVGSTLNDSVSGVRIRPVARGGSEPNEWLDVEVTVPAAPPNVVATWGGAQNFLDVPNATTNPPLNLKNVTAIATGANHVIALKADSTITGWGDNLAGQVTIPQINELITSIAAGGNLSGAVTRDGRITLWGQVTTALTPPANLTDVRQLAIGTNHVVALKNDGTLVGWGNDSVGQIAFGTTRDVVAIAAGTQTTVALKRDGTVVAFGGATIRSVPVGLDGVVAITARGTHGLALRNDGTVIAWGNNGNGQVNVPIGLKDVIAISAGDFHSLALKADGSVVAWGSNGSGKLNIPPNLPRVKAIEGAPQASFALVGPRVFITAQPAAQVIAGGDSATLSVSATGTGALTYQWRRNGVAIPGATASTLTLANFSATQAGNYDVVVRDETGSTLTATPAALSLRPVPLGPEVARISNLSILTSLASRTDSFRMGFVVGGTGTSGVKPVVIRAAGPSLGALGVPGTLGDPTVQVLTGSTIVAENDDWNGITSISNAMAAVGAFPLTDRLDAAVVLNIAGRDNTVIVGSAAAGAPSGLVIAEVYDATPSYAFIATAPRLINVSVLKNLGSQLTAGFVVAGPSGATKRVLVRAVGPGLSAFGITSGFVADPQLVLFGPGSARLGANNDWGGTAELSAAFTAVGAFGLPAGSRDAALVATLQTGDHSVVVTPASGATGLALIEVYEVP